MSQRHERSVAFSVLGWTWWAVAATVVASLTRKGLRQPRLSLRLHRN